MNDPKPGAEGSTLPRLIATYDLDITLREPPAPERTEAERSMLEGYGDADAAEPLEALKVNELVGLVKTELEQYGYIVNVTGERTDSKQGG